MVSLMKNYPLVSILVPAYNHDAYVESCLDSVLNEPYPNKELIIINDGSTDKTHEIIVKWVSLNEDNINIRYFSRENRGICKTLNELITNAEGEFIRVIASDDYLLAGGLEAMVDHLVANPSKKAVIGDCVVIDDVGHIVFNSGFDWLKKDKTLYQHDHGLLYEVIANWGIPGPVLMVRKDIYKDIGNYDERLLAEDWDFYLRVVANNYLSFLDFPVAAYRRHKNNYSLGRVGQRELHIKLLNTRLASAKNRLKLFYGKYKLLLGSEIYLLKAKISYLKRKTVSSLLNLICYITVWVFAKSLIVLKN